MDEPTTASVPLLTTAATVRDLAGLGRVLRELRRWDARRRGDAQLTYRELAAKTGWSQAAIWDYFAGRTLPSTDRFDDLVRLLGATPAEQGVLATARDRVEESRRRPALPGNDTPADPVPAAPVRWEERVPCQLPPAVPQFVGRDAELATLFRLVEEAGDTAVISTICGMAGIGKTTLAVSWAHHTRDRFPDGQLFVDLRGFDPTGQLVLPAEALRSFLDAFGVPPQRAPVELEAQSALFRSLLADRRVLVVLDNARDAEQVRPLLPGTAGCLTVITSRDQLSGLVATHGAHPLTLDLLPAVDARRLLTRRIDADRTDAEHDAVDELVTHCARLPLALSIVAARAATHPHFSLRALADQLHHSGGGLDAFAGSDPHTDVRAVFFWSYRALDADAARLFRLIPLHPGSDLTVSAAASLAGTPVSQTRVALATLAGAHLLMEHLPGRYAMHDLVRAYAGEVTRVIDPEGERRAAVGRVLDHYVHTAYRAAVFQDPNRSRLSLDPVPPNVTRGDLTDFDAAMAWFTAEYRNLLAAIARAESDGRDTQLWQLAWGVFGFLQWRGHWHDGVWVQRAALAAAQRLFDVDAQARAHNNLGGSLANLGLFDDARGHYLRAVELNREIGSLSGQAANHVNMAVAYNRQGDHEEALRHAQRSLDLYRSAGHRDGYAYALNEVGRCHGHLGDHRYALSCAQEALDINRELEDRRGQAECWDYLGRAYHQLGDHRRAIECYLHALDLDRMLGDRGEEATITAALGDAYHAAGRTAAANAAWTQALSTLDELGDPDADWVRSRLADGEDETP